MGAIAVLLMGARLKQTNTSNNNNKTIAPAHNDHQGALQSLCDGTNVPAAELKKADQR